MRCTTSRGRIATRASRAHCGAGPSASPLWRRDDLFEAAPDWRDGQPQAGDAPVCGGPPAGEKVSAQEDPDCRSTAVGGVPSLPIRSGRWTSCLISTAEGRVINSLTVVNDATHEAVAIVPERAGGHSMMRIWDRLAMSRGSSKAIRTDNA